MRAIKRQEVEFNLPQHVDNWNIDFSNGLLLLTRALYPEDLEQLSESGKLELPNEVVVYLKSSGYAIIMTIKEDSEPQVSSIFPSLDGDLVVDIIFEVAEIQFITVPSPEE